MSAVRKSPSGPGRSRVVRRDRRAADHDVVAARPAGAQILDPARVAEERVARGAAVDRVVAVAAEDDQRQRRARPVDRVVPTLAVDHQRTRRSGRDRDRDRVCALPGEERGHGLAERRRGRVAREDARDREGVPARAAVDVDPAPEQPRVPLQRPVALAGEVAAGRPVRDRRGREADQGAARERRRARGRVGAVADAEGVATRAGVDRERTRDQGERAVEGEVVDRDGAVEDLGLERGEVAGLGRRGRGQRAEIGRVGDVDDVVTGSGGEARDRQRPAHVEAVVAGAERDVEALDVRVIDPVAARDVGAGARERRHRPRDLALEADHELAAELPDEHALGAPARACATAAHRREHQLLQARLHGRRVGPCSEARRAEAGQRDREGGPVRVDRVDAHGAGATHPEPRQRRLSQRAEAVGGLARVVHDEPVAARAAVDCEQRADPGERPGGAADGDRVVAAVARDERRPSDREHAHRVAARSAGESRRPAMRGRNRERVVARAEVHVHGLEVEVDDPGGGHPEPAHRARGQRARLPHGDAAVVHIQRVDLVGLDHQEVRVARHGKRAGRLAREQHRRREQRRAVRIVPAVDVERALDPGEAGHRIAHVGRVAPEAAVDPGVDRGRGGEDDEVVVALDAVDRDPLDVDDRDEQARAGDAVGGDREGIVELGADHEHGVEAVAAVDRERRVLHVLDEIGARARVQRGEVVDRGEGADHERVVARVAVGRERSAVVEDRERVAALAAVERGREADPVGEVAPRGRGQVDRGEEQLGPPEQLADLEGVGADTAVHRRRGAVVVEREAVIAFEPVHGEAARDLPVVVHELGMGVGAGGEARQRGDETRAEEELVGRGRAVDRERVHAAVEAGVEHVDRRVAVPEGVDEVGVGAGAAVEREQRADPVQRARRGEIAVDGDRVVAGLAVHEREAGDRLDVDRVGARPGVQCRQSGVGREDGERVAAGAEVDRELLEVPVADPDRHPEPGDRVEGQRARVRRRVARVEGGEDVVARAAVDLEQRGDPVEDPVGPRRRRADEEGVGAVTAVDVGEPGDRLDVEVVVAAPGVECRLADVRGRDREGVAARAEVDPEELEARVGDAGGAETRQVGGGERAVARCGVAGVAHVQRVSGSALAVDDQVARDPARRAEVRGGVRGHVHGVGAWSRACRRDRERVRAADVEPVVALPELDVEHLDVRVPDAGGAEAGEQRGGQSPLFATASPRSLRFSTSPPPPWPSIVRWPASRFSVPRFAGASEETLTVSLPPPVSTSVSVEVLRTSKRVPPPPSATASESRPVYVIPAPRPRPVIVVAVSRPSFPTELPSPVSSTFAALVAAGRRRAPARPRSR